MQAASKQGCQFLRALFTNMFIAEPQEALQDVMEVNFGFQIESIAGVAVEKVKKEAGIGKETEKEKEVSQPVEDASSDSAVMPESDKSVPAEVEE